MHKGNHVYILPGGKRYHLKDDDCPQSSSVMNGGKSALLMTEDEAKRRGFTLCKTCKKEYMEDQRDWNFLRYSDDYGARLISFYKAVFKMIRSLRR